MPEKPDLLRREEIPQLPIHEDILKFILDRTQIPEVLAHVLKGETWMMRIDDKGRKVGKWEETGIPLMNQKGVKYFMSVLLSSMTVDKIATYLTEIEVIRMARQMRENVVFTLMTNADDFGIDTTPSNLTMIVDIIDHFYFSNLTAARKGTLLEVLKPMVKRQEIYRPMDKGGLWAKIFPRGEKIV